MALWFWHRVEYGQDRALCHPKSRTAGCVERDDSAGAVKERVSTVSYNLSSRMFPVVGWSRRGVAVVLRSGTFLSARWL